MTQLKYSQWLAFIGVFSLKQRKLLLLFFPLITIIYLILKCLRKLRLLSIVQFSVYLAKYTKYASYLYPSTTDCCQGRTPKDWHLVSLVEDTVFYVYPQEQRLQLKSRSFSSILEAGAKKQDHNYAYSSWLQIMSLNGVQKFCSSIQCETH